MEKRSINYEKVLENIRKEVKEYISNANLKCIVCGISGGLDSGINAAILSPICKELDIPFIGRYISIETNKKEERERADAVGNVFCTDYKRCNFTFLYKFILPFFDKKSDKFVETDERAHKIRLGNIKARLRMIYLYHLASKNKGLVLDNDNLTERELGFWTINGDVGDLTPLSSLYKTEVYELARYIRDNSKEIQEKVALDLLINAVPTDGLGITSSDVEQFGVSSYNEVDDILMSLLPYENEGSKETFDKNKEKLYSKYSKEIVDNVWNRHKNSDFKRVLPHRVLFNVEEK